MPSPGFIIMRNLDWGRLLLSLIIKASISTCDGFIDFIGEEEVAKVLPVPETSRVDKKLDFAGETNSQDPNKPKFYLEVINCSSCSMLPRPTIKSARKWGLCLVRHFDRSQKQMVSRIHPVAVPKRYLD